MSITSRIKQLECENEALKGKEILERHAKLLGIALTPKGYTFDGKHYQIEDWEAIYREVWHREQLGETGRLLSSLFKSLLRRAEDNENF